MRIHCTCIRISSIRIHTTPHGCVILYMCIYTYTYMYIYRQHTYHICTNFCGMYTIWQIVPASGLVMLIFTKECISAVGSFGGDRKVCANWKFSNSNSFYKNCEIQPDKFIASAVCTPHGPHPGGMRCTSSNMYC